MQTASVAINEIMDCIEMESDDLYYYLDRVTGETVMLDDEIIRHAENKTDPQDLPDWQKDVLESAISILADENNERFLPLPDSFDVHEWQIMADFAASQNDESIRDRLNKACHGSGAFRRFRSTVDQLGVEKQWFDFRTHCFRQKAIDWCEANNVPWH